MAKEKRTQLNINIDPALLLELKSEAIKAGKTLTEFVTQQLKGTSNIPIEDSLEKRLNRIEKCLHLNKDSSDERKNIGVIFSDEGAKIYGEVSKEVFDSFAEKKGITVEDGLKELTVHLKDYPNANPELVFQILLGNHQLTGLEMTIAYRNGSCAMRSALNDWSNDPLETLNEAFLNAVITKSLK